MMMILKKFLPYLVGGIVVALYMGFVRPQISQTKVDEKPALKFSPALESVELNESKSLKCQLPPPLPMPVIRECPICPRPRAVACRAVACRAVACKPRLVPLVIEPSLGCTLKGSKETGTLIGYAPAGYNLKCTIDRVTGKIDARYWYSNNTHDRDVYNVRQ